MNWVTGFGYTNVDLLYSGMARIPREGEEIYAESFSMQLGGGIPATLINLGRLGVSCRIQTMLGEDMFSAFANKQYQDNGVEPHNLYVGTGMAVNLTSAVITAHDRAFISYTDNIQVTDSMQQEALGLSQGAGIILMQEQMLPIYPALKAAGALMVYDTGWRDDMSLGTMEEVLRLADWYTPNDKEAMKITGTNNPLDAARALSPYFDTVVIKLGKDGCLLYNEGKQTLVPPLPGVVAVDSTGAGDAFLAGFTYGLYHGADAYTCALYGNITGGTCVKAVGCLASYVNEQQLLALAESMKDLP